MARLLAYAGRKIPYAVFCHEDFENMVAATDCPDLDDIKNDPLFIESVEMLGCRVEETIIIKTDCGLIYICEVGFIDDAKIQFSDTIKDIEGLLRFLKKMPKGTGGVKITINGERLDSICFDGQTVNITSDCCV